MEATAFAEAHVEYTTGETCALEQGTAINIIAFWDFLHEKIMYLEVPDMI